MGATYDVKTDLDPTLLTEVAAETYRQWLEFALGRSAIGGKVLAHPSGRYAAALSWQVTGEASVAIIADDEIAPEVDWIEQGRAGADIKEAMLAGGKMGLDGHRYRDIPIRSDPDPSALSGLNVARAVGMGHLPAGTARIWGQNRSYIDPNAHWVRMTDAPGSSEWRIEAMPAYSPAATLASLLRSNIDSFLGN